MPSLGPTTTVNPTTLQILHTNHNHSYNCHHLGWNYSKIYGPISIDVLVYYLKAKCQEHFGFHIFFFFHVQWSKTWPITNTCSSNRSNPTLVVEEDDFDLQCDLYGSTHLDHLPMRTLLKFHRFSCCGNNTNTPFIFFSKKSL